MSRLMDWITSRQTVFFIVAALAAASAPLLVRSTTAATAGDAFPGWPSTLEGRTITPLPLSTREAAFARDFPGRIGRFTDGEREVILRWVATPTRRLHPSTDCFRALGYKLTTRPMRLAANGEPMSCFRAERATESFEVCEQMRAINGGSWPDVSSWYWHALWAPQGQSWWSIVVASPVPRPAS